MARTAEVPHPLPAPLLEVIARRFRLLGEPMRIRLLEQLRDGPRSVQQLQSATGASQQNVSKHLCAMLGGGLVSRTKDGNFSYYEIADPVVFDLCDLVCGRMRDEIRELGALLEGAE